MKKLLSVAVILAISISVNSQVTSKLQFRQGQEIGISMDVKTTISQVANGQAIDFNVDGTATHAYKVTNATADNTTLHHEVRHLTFNFEGMGQKKPFDSNNEKDMEGPIGKPIKETMKKSYDLIIDPSGKVLMTQPEKVEAAQMDERMKLIASMLKDILDVVQPPKKGGNSFFKIFPDKAVNIGESWTDTYENEIGKFTDVYTLSEANDTAWVVSLNGTSATTSRLEIMAGMEIVTTLNNKTTGTILIDKATGIVRQRNTKTESSGTTQGFGGETPLTSTNTINIRVTQ